MHCSVLDVQRMRFCIPIKLYELILFIDAGLSQLIFEIHIR